MLSNSFSRASLLGLEDSVLGESTSLLNKQTNSLVGQCTGSKCSATAVLHAQHIWDRGKHSGEPLSVSDMIFSHRFVFSCKPVWDSAAINEYVTSSSVPVGPPSMGQHTHCATTPKRFRGWLKLISSMLGLLLAVLYWLGRNKWWEMWLPLSAVALVYDRLVWYARICSFTLFISF